MNNLPEFKCQKCQTSDVSKFTKTSKNICKECKKSLKPCKCKHCGDEDRLNFFEGRYTTCKKCKNNVKNVKNLDTKFECLPYNYELNLQIENFIMNDFKIFRGITVKQKIVDSDEKIKKLEEKISELTELCENLRIEVIKYRREESKKMIFSGNFV